MAGPPSPPPGGGAVARERIDQSGAGAQPTDAVAGPFHHQDVAARRHERAHGTLQLGRWSGKAVATRPFDGPEQRGDDPRRRIDTPDAVVLGVGDEQRPVRSDRDPHRPIERRRRRRALVADPAAGHGVNGVLRVRRRSDGQEAPQRDGSHQRVATHGPSSGVLCAWSRAARFVAPPDGQADETGAASAAATLRWPAALR